MGCEHSSGILHGYIDNELDAVRSAEFELHLRSCPDCSTELENAEALRAAMQRSELYQRAPATLRAKVRTSLQAETKQTAPAKRAEPVWRWVAAAAAILALIAIGWLALPSLTRSPTAVLTSAELIDAHVRSLQPGHLTDVISTDQHTVKPWFDGKIDFIPPVRDFSNQGFSLMGGRLDVLAGRSVAVLVYARRKHIVNVFIWPSTESGTQTYPPGSRQGYNWIEWRHGGMQFCAVSDLDLQGIRDLVQLIDQP